MIVPRAASEVEQQLAEWERRDDEAGRTAAKRRQAASIVAGVELRNYEFHQKPNDWVHRDWMKPIRFVYRNIPYDLRMQVKKRLAK